MANELLEDVLERAWKQDTLTSKDIDRLLSLKDTNDIAKLFNLAKAVKERSFGDKVFLYGFVYFSTHCRNNCSFCFYRKSNHESVRYRKTKEEIISLATALEDAGVHLIDLTMGEDPMFHSGKRKEALLDVIRTVNDSVRSPIMASPGVVPEHMFGSMRDAGVDWFACYQETHNKNLFRKLRPDQDYDYRFNQKLWARQAGILTEEGIMIGVGETIRDRSDSIRTMGEQGVQQIRAMTFVPQKNTPMEGSPATSYLDELKTLAVMRLVHQDKLIPASLDIEGVKGLKPRLDVGANVITSIIPPQKGLAGVAQHELDIDSGERSPQNIEDMLNELNVTVASAAEYNSLIESWRLRLPTEALA